MNNELKQKWVDALRSGNYAQGRGILRSTSNEYCCLGVLGEVAGYEFEHYNSQKYCLIAPESEGYGRKIQLTGTFSDAMLHQFGLDEAEMYSLIGLNDSQSKSFLDIADYVEKNL